MFGRQTSTLLLALGLALPVVACGPSGEEEGAETTAPVEQTPEPTEAPTPEPTPTPIPPMDTWQKMTTFSIADENDGLDIDGDGSKDNGIYAALESISDSLLAGIEAGLDAAVEAGTLTPQQAQLAQQAAEGVVTTIVSVDTINAALATNIETAEGFLAYNIAGSDSEYTIFYWTADSQSGGEVLVPTNNIGEQSTSDNPRSGTVTFGPGTFEFSATLTTPTNPQTGEGGDEIELGFAVNDALTKMEYDPTLTTGALTGGGVKIVALTALVEAIVELLVETLPEGTITDPDQIVADAEASLEAASDIECSDGSSCFSITFAYDAVTENEVVEP